ncbi:hypothetical protein MMC21_002086 [Puttea exsequens]|nr:hypothetical protein [Puttea exsequens]
MFPPTSGSRISNPGSSDLSSSDPGSPGAYTAHSSIAGPSTTDPGSGDLVEIQALIIQTTITQTVVVKKLLTQAIGSQEMVVRALLSQASHSSNGGPAKSADFQPGDPYLETASNLTLTVATLVPNSAPTFEISISGEMSLSATTIDMDSIILAGSTVEAGTSVVQVFGHQASRDPATSTIAIDGGAHPLLMPDASLATRPSFFIVGGQILILYSGRLIAANSTVSHNNPGPTRDRTAVSLAASVLYIWEPAISLIPPNSQTTGFIDTIADGAAIILANGLAIDGVIFRRAQVITIGETPVSLGASGLVIGISTILSRN